MSELSGKNIKFLPGVGAKRAVLLNKDLGILSYEDLLYHFPYKYVDKSKLYSINELSAQLAYVQVKGRVTNIELIGEKRSERLHVSFTDGAGIIDLLWFKGAKYIKSSIKIGQEYIVFGKPSEFNGRINLVHPEIDKIEDANKKIQASFQAFYHTSEKMKSSYLNSKAIHKLQESILQTVKDNIPETLPAYLIDKLKLINLNKALLNIHFPENADLLRQAQYRLKFEELFYIQLNILRMKQKRKIMYKGHVFPVIGDAFNSFYNNNLPFELTGAQKKVLKEIRKDFASGKHMNRLLQGDVGSGKTLVALMSMLMAVDNDAQACIMAPTEILAIQHLESISEFLNGINVNIALLTGSTKKKDRIIIHEKLLNGELDILIGTHALLEDIVQFKNLALVVIDEQHRFGVAQRARLWKKNTIPPHVLVMTATPIPRTLAMTLYGDLDVSIIDELPPGRKPIQTVHYYDNRRKHIYDFIKKQIDLGRQIYFVYPMIKESEKLDYKNLEEGYDLLMNYFKKENYGISMVHGKMKPVEKEMQMQSFAQGKTQILVATTVIEVGVNVPNATVMVIESSERFGLSQLHQLRGRVGRGGEQSFCILMSSYKISTDSRKRLETMVRTNDGFEIAEEDLKLRGPGDMDGTQQSGVALDLKIAKLATDGKILQYARDIANAILDSDPLIEKKENYVLAKQLKRIFKTKMNWSIIS